MPRRALGRSAAARRAFTVIELMLVLAIAATLMALGFPMLRNALDQARITRAIGDIRAIQIDLAELDARGALPATLAEIGRGNMRDPWGRPYEYLRFDLSGPSRRPPANARKDRFLVPINSTYDLYSRGKNGTTAAALTSAPGRDDIVRANDGGFIGLASKY